MKTVSFYFCPNSGNYPYGYRFYTTHPKEYPLLERLQYNPQDLSASAAALFGQYPQDIAVPTALTLSEALLEYAKRNKKKKNDND